MSTAEPTNQPADQPPSQPTAPPASPNADQQYASSASEPRRRLVRRTDDRMIGGVCAGVASHLGLDVTLVRVLTVVLAVLGFGSVIVAYLVAWVIVPKDTDVAVPASTASTASVWSG